MPIIQSVERALQILDLFNEQATELKITDISKLMGLSKSTLHSLLKTLQLHGYIDQNPENGKYRLGMKLVERGHFVVGSIDIRQKAKSWLTALSRDTGQTTHLGILDGREGVYIEKIEGKLAAIAYSRIGRRLPVHATAIGKVLIAWLDDAELNPLLEGYQYTTFTPATITSRQDLLAALKALRRTIAADLKKPAYIVFSDATLLDMAEKKPTNIYEFHLVNGVGDHKAAQFGKAFLQAITEWQRATTS